MAKQRGRREKKSAFKERSADGSDNEHHQELEEEVSEEVPTVKKQPEQFSTVFFGLVDSAEIEYFKQAESTLNIDAFEDEQDRHGFIRSVLEESRGKELKLVTNQICSKLMERLVLFATDRQLKHIFSQFLGHFAALAHHKYSSHVLETLLVRSAALIEKELAENYEPEEDEEAEAETTNEPMESMFTRALESLLPYWPSMMEHQYASHVMRIIILVVSGKELPSTTKAHSVARSKKSKIARKMIEIKDTDDFNRAFEVPPSFRDHLRGLISAISENLDTKAARELAIHKIASPVMQLLIRTEGIVNRDRPLWHLIFLPEKSPADEKESAFVEYLLSDPVGSHFLEAVITSDGARIKYIERLYRLYMRERVLKLARRSTTAVYIIQALLGKLKPAETEHILDVIIPSLAELISIADNHNIDLGKSVIDASISRHNYRRDELIGQLFLKFAPNFNPDSPDDSTSSELFENVLQLTGSTLGNTRGDWPTAEERRRSLFLEKLMQYDYSFVICVWLNCMALPRDRFIQMCCHGVFSHVVEESLVVKPAAAGEPRDVMILRKKFLNIFTGSVADLACNSYGSHIVDKLWHFTVLLPMYKDRIASELSAGSHKVKESSYGKLVWKNWSMELFARKKYDWKRLIKDQETEYYGSAETDGQNEVDPQPQRAKRPIDLKMEEIFNKKQRAEQRQSQPDHHHDQPEAPARKKVKVRGRNR